MKKITSAFELEEVRLVYKNKTKAKDRPKIRSARDAYNILISSWDIERIALVEEFKILTLDRSGRLMSVSALFVGGMEVIVIDPKVVFATALARRASSLILAHNHPSGTLEPSPMDIAVTRQLAICGIFLELPVYDHIIMTEHGFCSLNDKGHINCVRKRKVKMSDITGL